MQLLLIRRSKNPDKFCSTTNAVFYKTFSTVEEAVRWYAQSSKNCYIWEIRATRKERQQFWSKLHSQLDPVPSFAQDYFIAERSKIGALFDLSFLD